MHTPELSPVYPQCIVMSTTTTMAAPITNCSTGVFTANCCDVSSFQPPDTDLVRLKDCKRSLISHLIKTGLRSAMEENTDVSYKGDLASHVFTVTV